MDIQDYEQVVDEPVEVMEETETTEEITDTSDFRQFDDKPVESIDETSGDPQVETPEDALNNRCGSVRTGKRKSRDKRFSGIYRAIGTSCGFVS